MTTLASWMNLAQPLGMGTPESGRHVMTPLIYFRCRESDHQLATASNDAQPGSPITWHDGRWAYCPLGAADGHEWLELKTGCSVAEVRTKSVVAA